MPVSRSLQWRWGDAALAVVAIGYLIYDGSTTEASTHTQLGGGPLSLLSSTVFLGYVVLGLWVIRSIAVGEHAASAQRLLRRGSARRSWLFSGVVEAAAEALKICVMLVIVALIVTAPAVIVGGFPDSAELLGPLSLQVLFLSLGLIALRALLVAVRLITQRRWPVSALAVCLWLLSVTNASVPGIFPRWIDIGYAMNYAAQTTGQFDDTTRSLALIAAIIASSGVVSGWTDWRRRYTRAAALGFRVDRSLVALSTIVLTLVVVIAAVADSFSEFTFLLLAGYRGTLTSALIEATTTMGFGLTVALRHLKASTANRRTLEILRCGSDTRWHVRSLGREFVMLIAYCALLAVAVVAAGALAHGSTADGNELRALALHITTTVPLQVALYTAIIFGTAASAQSKAWTLAALGAIICIPPPGVVAAWLPLHHGGLQSTLANSLPTTVISLLVSTIAAVALIVATAALRDRSRRSRRNPMSSPKENRHVHSH